MAAEVGVEDMDFARLKKFEEEVPPLPVKFMPFYLFGVSAGPQTLNDKLFEKECEIIRKLAEDGPCVILGRCADDKFRSARGQSVYESKSLGELEDEDLKRGGYYSHYTDRKWGNPKYYDLSVNTSHISLEKAADFIISYIEKVQAK